jgi:hypothetical protein
VKNMTTENHAWQIDSNDHGHGHTDMRNDGMANHMHGKKLGGVVTSPNHARATHGHGHTGPANAHASGNLFGHSKGKGK